MSFESGPAMRSTQYQDNAADDGLPQRVDACQILRLAHTQAASERTLLLLRFSPGSLSPKHAAVARRVIARTTSAVRHSPGLTNNPPFIAGMIQVALGVDLRSDSSLALNRVTRSVPTSMCTNEQLLAAHVKNSRTTTMQNVCGDSQQFSEERSLP